MVGDHDPEPWLESLQLTSLLVLRHHLGRIHHSESLDLLCLALRVHFLSDVHVLSILVEQVLYVLRLANKSLPGRGALRPVRDLWLYALLLRSSDRFRRRFLADL